MSSVRAQVYRTNIIGYYNLALYPGDNLIANQVGNDDNALNTIFNQSTSLNQGIPEGTTFTKWDSAAAQFLPLSTYDTNRGWSINYTLSYGEGGKLNSPSFLINTFVGSSWSGFDGNGPYNPPLVSIYGTLLLSCYAPINSATFYDVVGRDPQDGESVTALNASSQISTTTTFQNGSWNNGIPSLNIGQSAFFNLEAVPEPEVLSLFSAGAVLLMACRQKRKR